MLRFLAGIWILPTTELTADESRLNYVGDVGALGLVGSETTYDETTELVALSIFLDFYSYFLFLFFSFCSISHCLFKLVQILALKSLSWVFKIIFSISWSQIGGKFYKSTISVCSIFAIALSKSIVSSCSTSSETSSLTTRFSSSFALITYAFFIKAFW